MIIAGAAAVPPVFDAPEEICFTNNINMLEHYSDSSIDLARKHASLTLRNQSFTIMALNTIEALTVANGSLVCAGALVEAGKDLVLKKMHSKFLGHQIMELLTDSAHQAIEQHSDFYTWVSQSRRKEEVDGSTILAFILACICPNFKVGTYSEITKVKKLTIAHYNNNVQLFFDAIKFLELHMNQKEPTAYTEDAFHLGYLSPTEARFTACGVLNQVWLSGD